MIIKCKCENAFQDKKYGKKMRVQNKTNDENKYRCTVCNEINEKEKSK